MGSLLRFPTVSADFSHLLGLLRTKRRRSWWAFVDERWTFLVKVFLLLMLFVVDVMETSCLFTNEKRENWDIFFIQVNVLFVVKIEKQLLSLLSNLLHLSSSLFSVSNFSLSLSLSLHPLYLWMFNHAALSMLCCYTSDQTSPPSKKAITEYIRTYEKVHA